MGIMVSFAIATAFCLQGTVSAGQESLSVPAIIRANIGSLGQAVPYVNENTCVVFAQKSVLTKECFDPIKEKSAYCMVLSSCSSQDGKVIAQKLGSQGLEPSACDHLEDGQVLKDYGLDDKGRSKKVTYTEPSVVCTSDVCKGIAMMLFLNAWPSEKPFPPNLVVIDRPTPVLDAMINVFRTVKPNDYPSLEPGLLEKVRKRLQSVTFLSLSSGSSINPSQSLGNTPRLVYESITSLAQVPAQVTNNTFVIADIDNCLLIPSKGTVENGTSALLEGECTQQSFKKIKENAAYVVVLTARPPDCAQSTHKNLKYHELTPSTFDHLKNDQILGNVYDEMGTIPIVYHEGAVFTQGFDKATTFLLFVAHWPPDKAFPGHLLFFDDQQEYLDPFTDLVNPDFFRRYEPFILKALERFYASCRLITLLCLTHERQIKG